MFQGNAIHTLFKPLGFVKNMTKEGQGLSFKRVVQKDIKKFLQTSYKTH